MFSGRPAHHRSRWILFKRSTESWEVRYSGIDLVGGRIRLPGIRGRPSGERGEMVRGGGPAGFEKGALLVSTGFIEMLIWVLFVSMMGIAGCVICVAVDCVVIVVIVACEICEVYMYVPYRPFS
jgi:hypothetical protein